MNLILLYDKYWGTRGINTITFEKENVEMTLVSFIYLCIASLNNASQGNFGRLWMFEPSWISVT